MSLFQASIALSVSIKGADSRIGSLERTQTATAIVRFGKVDPRNSDLSLQEKERAFDLTLRPRDRHRNLLGPGLSKEVRMTTSSGRIQAGPEDLGDGRYRFTLLSTNRANPSLTLTVSQHPLFKGTLRKMRSMKRR